MLYTFQQPVADTPIYQPTAIPTSDVSTSAPVSPTPKADEPTEDQPTRYYNPFTFRLETEEELWASCGNFDL